MSRRRTDFDESLIGNMHTYREYLDMFTEMAITMFDYTGLPDTIDPRYHELTLFKNGCSVFFEDDVLGYLSLPTTKQGPFNVYGEPINRRAYSGYNNYHNNVDINNSVIFWNNYLHKSSWQVCKRYAKRLFNLDQIIDINANAQRTPLLIECTEQQRLSLLNLYKEYVGNSPVVFGTKDLDLKSLAVLKTDAPYIADKIYDLKTNIYNECLTYLGIPNVSFEKRERVITDEVNRSQGGVIANRNTRLKSRQEACEKVNAMFGLNISVDYSSEYKENVSDDEMKEGVEDE